MDISNAKTPNEGTQQTRPVFLIILLLFLVGFGVYWYLKNNSTINIGSIAKKPEATAAQPISIDFDFLKLPEFNAMETLDYAAFRPATGTEVAPGRPNPFIPPTGVKTK